MSNFVGREYELNLLHSLITKKTASLVLIKGRRRIGKSRLAEEFAKEYTFYSFSGVPPHEKTSDLSEREAFHKQLTRYFKKPTLKSNDWWDMLWFLAERTKKGRVIILLDEISWMGSKDPDFLGKLKTIWDTCFKKNKQLLLILCGSVSIWIQKNILSSTGFVGRISLQLTLHELPINACNKFFNERSTQLSSYDKFKFLSICGGVPRYLEEWRSNISIDENINRMCFHESGILFNEFDQIFHDSISSEADIYRLIILALVEQPSERQEIFKKLKRTPGGDLSEYLENLVSAGFVTRDHTWHIKNKKVSILSQYRLSDNYLRFYLKYIKPQANIIKDKKYKVRSLSNLTGWSSIIGLQFENLVLSNREIIYKMLDISRDDVEIDGSFFQRTTTKTKGCQIDYLIQTKTSVLYVCEVKFSRNELRLGVIDEMKEKVSRISIPRGFSCLPVLIHVNGVHDSVLDKNYFFKVIDFSALFQD
ncbi:MAG: ATPase [Gammaproteobacteria bacterium RIFCSPLOWO2_02_FULL_38_11]|nr:MAG: ATPase [Gammaproteobacteria bacterium RIFCSPLOWO2_02_FULL_38_11]OGT76094.1 MAG: ATPase [Gammaproteobacteria bacterium RIFCSPLOWO2_12_FULL_38_14]